MQKQALEFRKCFEKSFLSFIFRIKLCRYEHFRIVDFEETSSNAQTRFWNLKCLVKKEFIKKWKKSNFFKHCQINTYFQIRSLN